MARSYSGLRAVGDRAAPAGETIGSVFCELIVKPNDTLAGDAREVWARRQP